MTGVHIYMVAYDWGYDWLDRLHADMFAWTGDMLVLLSYMIGTMQI